MTILARAIAFLLWKKQMANPPKTLDLGFLSTDVRNQIAHSTDVLSQVKVLRDLLPTSKMRKLGTKSKRQ